MEQIVRKCDKVQKKGKKKIPCQNPSRITIAVHDGATSTLIDFCDNHIVNARSFLLSLEKITHE